LEHKSNYFKKYKTGLKNLTNTNTPNYFFSSVSGREIKKSFTILAPAFATTSVRQIINYSIQLKNWG